MIGTAGAAAAAGAPEAGAQGSGALLSSGGEGAGAAVEQAAIKDVHSIANKRF
jgi:hypothetical protein